MNDIIKIVESLEKLILLTDEATEPIKYGTKNKKMDFLVLWWHMSITFNDENSVRRYYKSKILHEKRFLVPLLPFSNIETTKYFNYEPKFNGDFSRDNLPRIKHGVYVINLDDKHPKVTHWVSLFIDRNTAVYFDSFVIEYIPQKVLDKIKDKSNTHNILKIQSDQSLMFGFYSIAFIAYMLARKGLLDHIKFVLS